MTSHPFTLLTGTTAHLDITFVKIPLISDHVGIMEYKEV
jgi:hypothetical protein